MFYPYSIDKLQISSHLLNDLIDEFDAEINSKRQKSRIHKISELIDILWKRNLFQANASETLAVIFNRIPHDSYQETIKNYIVYLNHGNQISNGAVNVYGIGMFVNKQKFNAFPNLLQLLIYS